MRIQSSTPVAIIGDEVHKRSIVTFRMNRSMDVKMRKGAGVIAICFYPGMAYKFFEMPMYVLSIRLPLLLIYGMAWQQR